MATFIYCPLSLKTEWGLPFISKNVFNEVEKLTVLAILQITWESAFVHFHIHEKELKPLRLEKPRDNVEITWLQVP